VLAANLMFEFLCALALGTKPAHAG
jgi:hypothetical protein